MKKIIILIGLVLFIWTIAIAGGKDLEIQGKKLVSQKPPFTFMVTTEFQLIHNYFHENPKDNSLTRIYFFIKEKNRQVEEMLIVQIADKTNPQAGPMTAPLLKPYTEKRMYSKGRIKKDELEVNHLIQLIAWNPDAPSLQPLIKRGFVIPSQWALQGQFIFDYQGDHVVFVRYSKDVSTFGIKISKEGKDWEKEVISKNEKKVYETFKKTFTEMISSIHIKSP